TSKKELVAGIARIREVLKGQDESQDAELVREVEAATKLAEGDAGADKGEIEKLVLDVGRWRSHRIEDRAVGLEKQGGDLDALEQAFQKARDLAPDADDKKRLSERLLDVEARRNVQRAQRAREAGKFAEALELLAKARARLRDDPSLEKLE